MGLAVASLHRRMMSSIFEIPKASALDSSVIRGFNEIRYARKRIAQRERVQLRASSFPICPRAYVIYRRLPADRRPLVEQSFISDSATMLGTALHLALQKWFGIQGSLYGNWVCVRCRKIRRNHLGGPECKNCGRPMVYREYSIDRTEEVPFSGHIDGIIKTPSGYVLLDFKGNSLDGIRDLKNLNRPKESHYLQVNAYANVINTRLEDYGLTEKLSNIIILYVDRGKPWQTWLPLQVPVSTKLYRETVARIRQAEECLVSYTVPRGLCLSPADEHAKYCPWRTICFSPTVEGLLGSEVEPEDIKDYESEQQRLLLASYFESH